jgi:hypothetical protein
MDRTTIEIPTETRQKLKDARLSHESNYGETIDRLLNDDSVVFVTEDEVREIVNKQISERVVPEAQR